MTPAYCSKPKETKMAKCTNCDGTGKVEEDGETVDCPTCDGSGEVDASDVKEPPKD